MASHVEKISEYVGKKYDSNYPDKDESQITIYKAFKEGLVPVDEKDIEIRTITVRGETMGYAYVYPEYCRPMTDDEKKEWEDIENKRKEASKQKAAEKREIIAKQKALEKENIEKTVCFCGGKPYELSSSKGYDHDFYKPFMKEFIIKIEDLYNKGFRNFITGGGQGFEQLSFWAVERLKKTYPDIKSIVYIPYEGQDNIWNENNAFGKKEYRSMLNKADEVINTDKGYINPERIIGDLYRFRNEEMIKNSGTVVEIYSKDDSKNSNAEKIAEIAKNKKKNFIKVYYDINENGLLKLDKIEEKADNNTRKKIENGKETHIPDFKNISGKKIICFDTETTGIGKDDEILQLTITGFEDGEASVLYSSYFKPENKTEWTGAMMVNHISPRMVSDKPHIKDRTTDFKAIFESADIIAGYNVTFDVRMLEQSLGEGVINIPKEKLADPMDYYKDSEPDVKHKLINAVERYCPEKLEWFKKNAHDASADALATLMVLEAQARENNCVITEDGEKGVDYD